MDVRKYTPAYQNLQEVHTPVSHRSCVAASLACFQKSRSTYILRKNLFLFGMCDDIFAYRLSPAKDHPWYF